MRSINKRAAGRVGRKMPPPPTIAARPGGPATRWGTRTRRSAVMADEREEAAEKGSSSETKKLSTTPGSYTQVPRLFT